ncbi:GNAT family N-acetyltransferase [Paenibacillus sp. J2TS4]|uniref:GNAT family N-acetyltransferase n=1 Tax=Paenibacillus sp. J2TS4 TaxID=2807194 RepID=UPI001B001F6F|nr:GNAT family N-acetyltransferase [Paenibacillus sp. J2TS4]GIP32995.1 acetyltransferase [Paenibacillus sp. J2TS4]
MASFKRVLPDIITFGENDIPGLIELSGSVGWDYNDREIATILSTGRVYGHKNEEDAIISSAAVIPYGKSLASIGMVIVREDYRGMGLGRQVVQRCLRTVPKAAVMLIATEEGKPLYESMGFRTADYVHKFICDNYVPQSSPNFEYVITPFAEQDLPRIVELDKTAVGEERRTLLIHRIQQALLCLVAKDSAGRTVGYGLSVPGPVNRIIGPIVAPNYAIACLLINHLAGAHEGKIRIDVPSGHEKLMAHLIRCGFKKVSQPPVMIIHSDQLPNRNGTLFAIAAQVFG